MRETSRRIRSARSVTSSRLPIGVATTYRVPAIRGADSTRMYSAEPLPHFVDEYLAWLHEAHPTNATFDGVHLHDDLLEDLSRVAIDSQIRTLGGFARRLAAIDPARLTDVERLERPALEASIRARLFELESIRTWVRSPQ